jgi:hypothetical protein
MHQSISLIKRVAGMGQGNHHDFPYANTYPVLAKGLQVLKLGTSARSSTDAAKFLCNGQL